MPRRRGQVKGGQALQGNKDAPQEQGGRTREREPKCWDATSQGWAEKVRRKA